MRLTGRDHSCCQFLLSSAHNEKQTVVSGQVHALNTLATWTTARHASKTLSLTCLGLVKQLYITILCCVGRTWRHILSWGWRAWHHTCGTKICLRTKTLVQAKLKLMQYTVSCLQRPSKCWSQTTKQNVNKSCSPGPDIIYCRMSMHAATFHLEQHDMQCKLVKHAMHVAQEGMSHQT